LGVSIHEQYLEEQVREALGMPGKQNIVARLNFCVWTDSVSAWISKQKWDAVQVREGFDLLRGRSCLAALDLSSRKDLTACAYFFPDEDGGGDLFVEFWTPAEGLKEREYKDRVPYRQWVADGYLQTTPGASVDYAHVAQRIAARRGELDLHTLAFDRWRIYDLLRELDSAGVDARVLPEDMERSEGPLWLLPFGQGFKDMGPAVDELEVGIINGRIRVHYNPVLTYAAASAVLVADAAGSRKFTKAKATGRIDGIVASAMVVGSHFAVVKTKPTDVGIEVW
jgi:phage terminase large subunit-like protein